MRSLRLTALVVAAVAFLSGCAAPEIPFDRSSADDVKSIGIITPGFPSGPSVVLASTVGQSFGLVGALVDAGMEANRESQFETLLTQQNFSMQDSFVESLTAGLRARGYTPSVVPVQRPRGDFAEHYPSGSDPKVDAYLDIVAVDYGYIAAGVRGSTPYRPGLAVKARLVSARDSSVLMQDLVVYNPINQTSKAITIAPDSGYQFINFNALMADPAKAVKGLRTAATQSADAVANLLQ